MSMDAQDVEWRCICGQKNIDHDVRCVECGLGRYPDEDTLPAGTDWPADEAHRMSQAMEMKR